RRETLSTQEFRSRWVPARRSVAAIPQGQLLRACRPYLSVERPRGTVERCPLQQTACPRTWRHADTRSICPSVTWLAEEASGRLPVTREWALFGECSEMAEQHAPSCRALREGRGRRQLSGPPCEESQFERICRTVWRISEVRVFGPDDVARSRASQDSDTRICAKGFDRHRPSDMS